MSSPLAKQGFYAIHLFGHFPVQGLGELLVLVLHLDLQLIHRAFHSMLRGLDLHDCLINLAKLLFEGPLISLDLLKLVLKLCSPAVKASMVHGDI